MEISWKFNSSGDKEIIFIYRFGLYKQQYPVNPYDLIYAIVHHNVGELLNQTPRPDTEFLINSLSSYHLRKSYVYRLLNQKAPHPIKLTKRSSNWGGSR